MATQHPGKPGIPVLNDVIVTASPTLPPLVRRDLPAVDHDALVAELQTKLASRAFVLTEQVLRNAFAGIEAGLLEQITAKLRRDLPELIDATLREHLGSDDRS